MDSKHGQGKGLWSFSIEPSSSQRSKYRTPERVSLPERRKAVSQCAFSVRHFPEHVFGLDMNRAGAKNISKLSFQQMNKDTVGVALIPKNLPATQHGQGRVESCDKSGEPQNDIMFVASTVKLSTRTMPPGVLWSFRCPPPKHQPLETGHQDFKSFKLRTYFRVSKDWALILAFPFFLAVI